MKVVWVEHPKFQGEVLHLSEMPKDLLKEIDPTGYGLLDTVREIFLIGLVDPRRFDDFESLKISEMLQAWQLYVTAKPYEKSFFDDSIR